MTRRIPDAWVVALLIGLAAALTVGGAWAIQWQGYSPCELCLRERQPYYLGLGVALITAAMAKARLKRPAALGFALLIVIFMAGTVLGIYHAGVEWQVWPGPSECSGAAAAPAKVGEFLEQLNHVTVVRCDEVALRVFGLSLAVWNALISLALIGLANVGLLRSGTLPGAP